MSKTVAQTVEQLIQPYIQEEGFELVDIEYVKEGGQYFLRVYVDKPGGIDIEDCSRISEYLGAKLDEEDPIPNAYILEVSSPGAERPLKKPEDYRWAVGKYVLVKTYEPIGGQKEFEGTLSAYDEQTAVVHTGQREVEIPVSKIASARLAIPL